MCKWFIVIIVGFFLTGCLLIGFKFYQLSENIAWQNCIKDPDPSIAPNLVCRSLYPNAFKLWSNEFYK